MPVPIPGSKVGSDSQKVKFLTISGRPKTGIFGQISGVPGPFPQFPLATNHAAISGLINTTRYAVSLVPLLTHREYRVYVAIVETPVGHLTAPPHLKIPQGNRQGTP